MPRCRTRSCLSLIFPDAVSVSASSPRPNPALIPLLVKWQGNGAAAGGGAQRRVTADAGAVGRADDSLFQSLGLASIPPGAAPVGTRSGKALSYTNFTKDDFIRFFHLDMVSDPCPFRCLNPQP